MLFTAIGITGVVINLVAYALLSAGRLRANEARYQLLNIVGTMGILISLTAQWNLPSFVLNVAWLLIGLFSLIRITHTRRTA